MKRVVCENQQGQKIEFKYDGYPLRLYSTSGFSSTEYTVHTSQNSGQDGENYNGSQANKRNPVITANIFENFPEWGDRLRSFFQPRSWGTVYAYESDEDVGRKATYQVEKIDIDESGMPRDATISLICPDPKFYALDDQLMELAVWEGKITFPLRFPPQINAEGQSVTITPDASITDYDKIAITGATVETGNGTKSPDNPYTLAGTTTLTVSDGGSQSQTIALPQPLYSLPDGTHDEFEAVTGTGTQIIGKTVLNGGESWSLYDNGTVARYYTAGNIHTGNNIPLVSLSSHFLTATDTNFTAGKLYVRYIILDRIVRFDICFASGVFADVNAFKAWIASQAAAGTPVTVLYELAEPQTITGTAQTIPIYHPTTTLSLDAGTLALRCRGKFVVTEKINTLIGNVVNPSAVPMGLTVTFRASGAVVNPSLYDVNRRELMQINTTMHAGDVIIVTTGDGNKRVKLVSGGVTTNINNKMKYPPKWLKAYQGDNLFRYNADEGIDNLSVSILSTQAYWGA